MGSDTLRVKNRSTSSIITSSSSNTLPGCKTRTCRSRWSSISSELSDGVWCEVASNFVPQYCCRLPWNYHRKRPLSFLKWTIGISSVRLMTWSITYKVCLRSLRQSAVYYRRLMAQAPVACRSRRQSVCRFHAKRTTNEWLGYSHPLRMNWASELSLFYHCVTIWSREDGCWMLPSSRKGPLSRGLMLRKNCSCECHSAIHRFLKGRRLRGNPQLLLNLRRY